MVNIVLGYARRPEGRAVLEPAVLREPIELRRVAAFLLSPAAST